MATNKQIMPTGTTHPCKGCGAIFTVEENRNRTGEFCSVKCSRTFASRLPRPKSEARMLDDVITELGPKWDAIARRLWATDCQKPEEITERYYAELLAQ